MKRVGILSTSLILFVICLFSFSVNAFAFNNKYITDSGSWYKNGNLININNDVLSGQLRYILDENDKLVLIFTFYTVIATAIIRMRTYLLNLKFQIAQINIRFPFQNQV